jgi:hypothetical protein
MLKIQYIVVRVDYSVAIATSNRQGPFREGTFFHFLLNVYISLQKSFNSALTILPIQLYYILQKLPSHFYVFISLCHSKLALVEIFKNILNIFSIFFTFPHKNKFGNARLSLLPYK